MVVRIPKGLFSDRAPATDDLEKNQETLKLTENSAVVKLAADEEQGMIVQVGAMFEIGDVDDTDGMTDTQLYRSMTALTFYGLSALIKHRPHLLVEIGMQAQAGVFDPTDYERLPLSAAEEQLRDVELEHLGIAPRGDDDDPPEGCTGDPDNCPVCEDLDEIATEIEEWPQNEDETTEDPRQMSLEELLQVKPKGTA